MMNTSQKVTTDHLRRLAYLYVRQSSLQQVHDHRESTVRQYDLKGRAQALGWTADRIQVIDEDQGLSGASATERDGFQRLVADVGLGRVGLVMGLEVSRLARNSSDWHRLLEICALTETLILDEDGIYDPAHFNDRLLLGLKGTMSEAELHILAGRLQESKRAAARRGALRFPLPVGYIFDEAGHTVLDPHDEIRAAVADVFAAFAATGSAYGVVGRFRGRPFPRRAYGGAWAGEIRWGRLTVAALRKARKSEQVDRNTLRVARGRLRNEWWRVLGGIKALRFASTPRGGATALTPPARAPRSSYGDRSRRCDAVQISAFSDDC